MSGGKTHTKKTALRVRCLFFLLWPARMKDGGASTWGYEGRAVARAAHRHSGRGGGELAAIAAMAGELAVAVGQARGAGRGAWGRRVRRGRGGREG